MFRTFSQAPPSSTSSLRWQTSKSSLIQCLSSLLPASSSQLLTGSCHFSSHRKSAHLNPTDHFPSRPLTREVLPVLALGLANSTVGGPSRALFDSGAPLVNTPSGAPHCQQIKSPNSLT